MLLLWSRSNICYFGHSNPFLIDWFSDWYYCILNDCSQCWCLAVWHVLVESWHQALKFKTSGWRRCGMLWVLLVVGATHCGCLLSATPGISSYLLVYRFIAGYVNFTFWLHQTGIQDSVLQDHDPDIQDPDQVPDIQEQDQVPDIQDEDFSVQDQDKVKDFQKMVSRPRAKSRELHAWATSTSFVSVFCVFTSLRWLSARHYFWWLVFIALFVT